MQPHTERQRLSWREIAATARRRFGYERFRPGQRELIEAALAGENALGVLPTGSGKSLCFQLPALLLDGAVVVVSPLIALMQDQVAHLEAVNIAAARLDSTVPPAQQARREQEISRGQHDVVLVTPERLEDPKHLAPLAGRVALFVIDEAHCISQWGHDFRPAYLQLRSALEALGRPPVLALTATASPSLADDLRRSLGLSHLRVVQTEIERKNLFFEVARTVNRAEKEARLLELLDQHAGSSGIVYVATVKRVDELHEWLVERGVAAGKYHGRMSKRERERSQDRFMSGEVPLIVATNAFGLGIDKPDVRFVAHWHFPGSPESYYQEAGRAGRDGQPARCVLFYRLEDKRIRSFFLGGKRPQQREVEALLRALMHAAGDGGVPGQRELAAASGLSVKRVSVLCTALEQLELLERRGRGLALAHPLTAAEAEEFVRGFDARHDAERQRLEAMMRYGESAACRTRYLRQYFGEEAGEPCGHCDACEACAPQSAAT